MRYFNITKRTIFPLFLSAGIALCTACSEDDNFYDPLDSVDILSGITLKVTDPLPLLINTDTLIAYEVSPVDATNTEVIWRSADTDIATVDEDGLVTAHSVGKVQIIASPKVGFATTAQVTLEVIDHIVFIEDLNVGIDNPEVYASARIDLTENLSFTPQDVTYTTLQWESLTPEIATVDEEGVVTGVTEGTAQIKISARDGGGFSKTVSIQVKPSIEVTEINFDPAQRELALYEVSKLNITTNEGATASTIEWSSSAPGIVSVDQDGIVTCKTIGSAVLTAKTAKIESTFEVSVVEGKINDTFLYGGNNWKDYKSTTTSVEVVDGKLEIIGVTDSNENEFKIKIIREGTTVFKPFSYPIVAVKYEFPGTSSLFVCDLWNDPGTPDFGRYNNGGSMDKLEDNDGNEQTQVYYMDLSAAGKGFKDGYMSADEPTSINCYTYETWHMTYPGGKDDENAGKVYLHWVKTFASVDELKAYIETENQSE